MGRGRFMRNRMEDRFEIISAVHRALVEVFALKQAGLPLKIHSEAGVPEDEYVYRVAKGAKFEPNADGDMVLVFEDDELQQFILDNIRPRETPVGPETVEEEDLAEEELANRDGETGLDHESSTLGIAQTDDVIQASESNKSSTVENPWDQNDDPAVFMPMDNSWREVSLDNSYTKFSVSGSLPRCFLTSANPLLIGT